MCSQATEKVHLVKCLPCKPKELSLISRAHVRNVRGVSLGSMYCAGVGSGGDKSIHAACWLGCLEMGSVSKDDSQGCLLAFI